MPSVSFSHPNIGTLTIDTGIDDAQWAYGLNSVTYPTYGGEVVQILSVYLDNLTLSGSLTTYRQMEAIYQYFATYMQIATQGKKAVPNIGDSISSSAYNLLPVTFRYPHRDWQFLIYPQQAPGFHLGTEVVTPSWQLIAFVIDDTPDLALIKDGIKAAVVQENQLPQNNQGTFNLNGEISPNRGNPDTDPFQTYTEDLSAQQAQIQKYADYYNQVLIPGYNASDFSSLTGAIGSQPSFGKSGNKQQGSTVKLPKPGGKVGQGLTNVGSGNIGQGP